MELEFIAGFSKHAALNFGAVGNVLRHTGTAIRNAPTTTWTGVKSIPGRIASNVRGAGEAAAQPVQELVRRPGSFLKERARHLALQDMPSGGWAKGGRLFETAAFGGLTVPAIIEDATSKTDSTGRKRGLGERALSATGRGLGALIYSGDAMGRGGFGGFVGQVAGEEVMGRSGGAVGRKLDEFAAKIKNQRGAQQ